MSRCQWLRVIAGVVVAAALLYVAALIGAWDAAFFGGAP